MSIETLVQKFQIRSDSMSPTIGKPRVRKEALNEAKKVSNEVKEASREVKEASKEASKEAKEDSKKVKEASKDRGSGDATEGETE